MGIKNVISSEAMSHIALLNLAY